MEFFAYSVYDRALKTYSNPTFFRTQEECKRAIKAILSEPIIWADSPQDFDLYLVGIFNSETGLFTSTTPAFKYGLAELKKERIKEEWRQIRLQEEAEQLKGVKIDD